MNAFNFPKGKGKGKGFKGGKGSKGKGKDGKGGNKGKGKGGGKCWYCNQDGHYARECPVKEYHDGQWWTKGDGKGYGANAMDYVPPRGNYHDDTTNGHDYHATQPLRRHSPRRL